MYEQPATFFLATLGGQPQIITLALDLFFAQGTAIDEVIVVHLSTTNPRYLAAAECLDREFANNTYQGRPCGYKRVPIRQGDHVISDLDNDTAIKATLDALHKLFQSLKAQGSTIHLCLTGGRRLLGALSMSAAQLSFEHVDHAWHLYSSDDVRTLTKNGNKLHLPEHPDVRLLPVPIQPLLGHLFAFNRVPTEMSFNTTLDIQNKVADDAEHAKCQQVWDELSRRQRDVLRAFADGLTPQEVADQLGLAIGTINTHKTAIFDHCYNVWDLPHEKNYNILGSTKHSERSSSISYKGEKQEREISQFFARFLCSLDEPIFFHKRGYYQQYQISIHWYLN